MYLKMLYLKTDVNWISHVLTQQADNVYDVGCDAKNIDELTYGGQQNVL